MLFIVGSVQIKKKNVIVAMFTVSEIHDVL
jgi:hypothetical protein